MKLLAADYDSTLYTSRNGIKLNIPAIKKFRENGNKFVIATGRTFESIKKEINYYNIPYDYLSCNDGTVIFDSKNNLISTKYLNKFEINDISYYLNAFKKVGYIKKIIFYNEYKNILDCIDEHNENIVEIGAQLNIFKDPHKLIEEMKELFHTIEVYKYPNIIFIKKPKNKSNAVTEIAKIENIQPNNVFTVGDGKNDLEMVRDFNGYNMLFSHPDLYKVSTGTVTSVRQLIKKINKWVIMTHLFAFQIDYYINCNKILFSLIIHCDYLVL